MNALRDELLNDPDGRGYSAMTDKQALDDLNAQIVTQYIDVPVSLIAGEVISRGIMPKLRNANNESAVTLTEIVRGETAIQQIRYSVSDKRQATDAMLADIVANTTVTQSEADTLAALGSRDVSKAEALGHPNLTELQVKEARS